jgi:hypothetical protein
MALPPIIPDLPPAPSRSDGPAGFTPKADAMIGALQPMVEQINIAIAWISGQITEAQAKAQAAASSANAASQSASAAADSANAAALSANAATDNGAAQVALAAEQVELATEQAELATTNGQVQVQLAAQQAQLATTNGQAQVAAAEQVKQQTEDIRDQAQIIADAAQAAVGIPSYTGKSGFVFTVKDDGTGMEWRPRHRIGEVLQAAGIVDNTFLPLNGALYLQSAYPELFAKVGILGAVAGDTWQAYSTTVGGFAISSIRVGKDGVMLGKGPAKSTLYRSTDNGLTWSAISLVSAFGSSTHTMYAFDTDKKGVWVATAYYSSGTITFGARSTDNGLTWSAIPTSQLPSGLYESICSDGNGVWIAGTGTAGNLHRSSDNGVTWSQVYSTGGTLDSFKAVATDRRGTWLAFEGKRTFKSVDNGITWAISNNDTQTGSVYTAITDEKGTWMVGGDDPSTPSVPGISRSFDAGVTWTRMAVAGVGAEDIGTIITDGAGAWYAGTSAGRLIRSLDDTKSWQFVTPAKTGFTVFSTLMMIGQDVLALGNGGLIRKAPSATPYDSATLFKLPDMLATKGITNYIKAKEVA